MNYAKPSHTELQDEIARSVIKQCQMWKDSMAMQGKAAAKTPGSDVKICAFGNMPLNVCYNWA